ncbi:MAG: hypothetical protein V4481_02725 [Patescibacteria group bacterium]
MFDTIVTGDFANSATSATKGWVVFHSAPEGVAKTPALEIKHWAYDGKTPLDYGKKEFLGKGEYIIAHEGILEIEVEPSPNPRGVPSHKYTLDGSKRDFMIVPQGFSKIVRVIQGPTSGVTVRWPSHPDLNRNHAS